MKYFNCPNCDSRFPVKSAECPSCGESVAPSEWKEVEVDVPKPASPLSVELHGDLGKPFVFRKQPHAMGVGRPSLTSVSSQANCCEREQFVLSWEGDVCYISCPGTPPRNSTYVDGNRLTGRTELGHGSVVDLRGASGRTAMPLTILYA